MDGACAVSGVTRPNLRLARASVLTSSLYACAGKGVVWIRRIGGPCCSRDNPAVAGVEEEEVACEKVLDVDVLVVVMPDAGVAGVPRPLREEAAAAAPRPAVAVRLNFLTAPWLLPLPSTKEDSGVK